MISALLELVITASQSIFVAFSAGFGDLTHRSTRSRRAPNANNTASALLSLVEAVARQNDDDAGRGSGWHLQRRVDGVEAITSRPPFVLASAGAERGNTLAACKTLGMPSLAITAPALRPYSSQEADRAAEYNS